LEVKLQGSRLPALDGLRGVAILLVMLCHFGGSAWVTRWGWVGVDLFFVLSGFLITGMLLDAGGAPHMLSRFYVRRVLRIWPLYLVALTIILLVLPRTGLLDFATRDELRQAAPWFWTHVSNLYFLTHPIPFGTLHLWSLAVEEQFYLLWPLAVIAVGQRRIPRLVAGLLGLAIGLRLLLVFTTTPSREWAFQLPLRMDGLLVGCWLAWRVREPSVLSIPLAWWTLAGTAAGALILSQAPPGLRFFLRVPMLAGLFGALLVLAVRDALPWLRARRLRTLGWYSYGLYVIHYPLLGVLQRMGWWGVAHDPGRWLVRVALGIGLSGGLAWLSWHALEAPMLRFKRFFPMPVGAEGRNRSLGLGVLNPAIVGQVGLDVDKIERTEV
jgi:peptidoglycan/LPS O-acetylase OafA/YrhL